MHIETRPGISDSKLDSEKNNDFNMVELVSYNNLWPKLFLAESLRLKYALREYLEGVYHIGSTAIKGMSAKPKIDIILELKSLDNMRSIQTKLLDLGYAFLRSNLVQGFSYFTSRNAVLQQNQDELSKLLDEQLLESGEELKNYRVIYNLHIYLAGEPQIRRHLLFRDYLNYAKEAQQAYLETKQALAAKYKYDIRSYILGKTSIVKQIDSKARIWAKRNNKYNDRLIYDTGKEAFKWHADHLIKALEANLAFKHTHLEQFMSGVELERVPEYTAKLSRIDNKEYNTVLDINLHSGNQAAEIISQLKDKFSGTPFTVYVTPNSKPNTLERQLLAAGFTQEKTQTALCFNLDAWVPQAAQLEIRRALTIEQLLDFAGIYDNKAKDEASLAQLRANAVVMEEDKLEIYVAYVDNKPVARGLLVLYAGLATIYDMATVSNQRGLGYATQIKQYMLRRARNLGYHVAATIVNEEVSEFFEEFGFNSFCKIKKFSSQA